MIVASKAFIYVFNHLLLTEAKRVAKFRGQMEEMLTWGDGAEEEPDDTDATLVMENLLQQLLMNLLRSIMATDSQATRGYARLHTLTTAAAYIHKRLQ